MSTLLKRQQALISHSASELPTTGLPRPPWDCFSAPSFPRRPSTCPVLLIRATGVAGSGSRLLPPCHPQAEVPPNAGLGVRDPQEGVKMSLQSAPVRQSQSTGPGGWTKLSGGGRSSGCGKLRRRRRRRWRQKLPLLCEPARGRGRGRRRWERGRRSWAGGTLGFLGSCEQGLFQRQAESRQGLQVSGFRGDKTRKPDAAGLGARWNDRQ